MVASISDVPKGSLVYRFITAGKPGYCELCKVKVEKLEAHHLQYSPEKTINICHNCHHKVHFWPNRLNDDEKLKLLRKRFDPVTAVNMVSKKTFTLKSLARLIAPSRSVFVRKQQDLEIKRIAPKYHKVFKKQKISKKTSLQLSPVPREGLLKK